MSPEKTLKLKGYYIERFIGKGAFANVYECRKYFTKKKYAAKVVEFNGNSKLKYQTEDEIEILKQLSSHRHIVRLHAVQRDSECTIQMLEYIPGCTFFNGILNWTCFKERNLKSTIKQLLSALAYCHSKRIVHRDVSPENIMWYQIPTERKPHQPSVLKLIDFNLARRIPENSKRIRADALGNPSYMAPECLDEKPTVLFASDIWSIGVIAFTLMAGYPPFWNDNYNHLLTNIIEANYIFPESLWKHVSNGGREYIKKILCKDMYNRPSAEELLKNKWLCTLEMEVNTVWLGHSRLKLFLQNLEEKRSRSSHRRYTLESTERTAFIPNNAMFLNNKNEKNINREDENNNFLKNNENNCYW